MSSHNFCFNAATTNCLPVLQVSPVNPVPVHIHTNPLHVSMQEPPCLQGLTTHETLLSQGLGLQVGSVNKIKLWWHYL